MWDTPAGPAQRKATQRSCKYCIIEIITVTLVDGALSGQRDERAGFNPRPVFPEMDRRLINKFNAYAWKLQSWVRIFPGELICQRFSL
jgi:hypothetical protein